MRPTPSHSIQYLKRGVWVAPWMGPNGEVVLVAISRAHKIIGEPVIVPLGGDHVGASDALWERVEQDDPVPRLMVI